MNIQLKTQSAPSAVKPLTGRVSLVTGSFLSSEAAASITGIALPVDGGWTAH
jgi:hypothetical protein